MENQMLSRDDSLKSSSFIYRTSSEGKSQQSWNDEFGFGGSDRRFAYTRQSSFRQQSAEPHTPISIISNDSVHPLLSRSVSGISKTPSSYPKFDSQKYWNKDGGGFPEKYSFLMLVLSVFRIVRSGNRPMRRLFVMISLNVAYTSTELLVGLFTGRIVLSFSLSSSLALDINRENPNPNRRIHCGE